jgi:hypothetical protein
VVALGASSAFAQGVAYQMSSNVRSVRAEGLAEAVGQVTLTSTSAGTVTALSTISFDFGVDIISDENVTGQPDPTDTVDANFATPTAGTCTEADLTADDVIDGSVLFLEFDATCTIQVGNTITIKGIRVNANDAGVGATINAKGTATAPSGGAPITFFIVNTVAVAEVQTAFDIEITASTPVLTCNANEIAYDDVFTDDDYDDESDPGGALETVAETRLISVKITEEFNQAFSDATDETGYAPYTGGETDMTFTITFKDVPTDVNIELVDIILDSSGSLLTLGGIAAGDDADGEGDDIEFAFDITATRSSGDNEEIALLFAATTSEAIDSVGAGFNVDVAVSFEAGDLDTDVPAFVDNEVEDLGVTVSDCLSILLFPWVANTGDGVYDTGFAIANTSLDPAAIGTEGQEGKVTMYFFRNTGSNNPASVVMDSSLGAGETTTGVLSSMVSGSFLGYAIAICEFQMGHGFAFINSPQPGTGGQAFQGYLGLSLSNPRSLGFVGDTTESAGQ